MAAKKVKRGKKVAPSRPARKVRIFFNRKGKLVCEPERVGANRGDTIVWKIEPEELPFAISLKCQITPLKHHFYLSGLAPKSKKLVAAEVLKTTPNGRYPYAIGAFNGKKVLYLDPDIIVPKPGGRG